jgi:hypothetical protein
MNDSNQNKQRTTPKTIMGALMLDADMSENAQEIEDEMHQEMLEILHPLRGAELNEIFPVLQYLDKTKSQREAKKTLIEKRLTIFERSSLRDRVDSSKLKEMLRGRSSVKKNISLLQKAGSLGKSAIK